MALSTQILELVDAFSELVAQHVRLAKMELAEDARFVGARVGLIAAFVPLILVGYGFLCVGLSLALARLMPMELSFVLVGVLNLAIGGVGIAVAGKQLSQRKVLDATTVELESTRTVVSVSTGGPR
jgi:uncharacterized membrane protein YqjE